MERYSWYELCQFSLRYPERGVGVFVCIRLGPLAHWVSIHMRLISCSQWTPAAVNWEEGRSTGEREKEMLKERRECLYELFTSWNSAAIVNHRPGGRRAGLISQASEEQPWNATSASVVSICFPLVCFIFGNASLDGVQKKKSRNGWDWGSGGDGASSRNTVCACCLSPCLLCLLAASGETSRPDVRPALLMAGEKPSCRDSLTLITSFSPPTGPSWSSRSPAATSSWWWWTTSVTAACSSPLPWTPSRSCISLTGKQRARAARMALLRNHPAMWQLCFSLMKSASSTSADSDLVSTWYQSVVEFYPHAPLLLLHHVPL